MRLNKIDFSQHAEYIKTSSDLVVEREENKQDRSETIKALSIHHGVHSAGHIELFVPGATELRFSVYIYLENLSGSQVDVTELLYIELTVAFLVGRKRTMNFRNQRL